MKDLKRQAREMINDITEKHCVTCTKKLEHTTQSGRVKTNFITSYCSIECPAGRDLKKLGEYLDIKTNKPKGDEVVEVKQMEATKENYEMLHKEGKKNHEIAQIFGMSEPNFYYRKKKWKEEKPKKENKSFGKHLADFVTEKEAAAEMPIIQPDYTIEFNKLKEEINLLYEINHEQAKKLEEKAHIETYNRETHQQNAELRQTVTEQSKAITEWIGEFKALQKKYESLVTYTKEIM